MRAVRGGTRLHRALQRVGDGGRVGELGGDEEGGSIEGPHLLAEDRLHQRAGVEIDGDPDVAGERRNQVLLHVQATGVGDAIAHPCRVRAGGARQLAPERSGRRGNAQVGGGAGRELCGQIRRGPRRSEGCLERVAGQVAELGPEAELQQLGLIDERKGGGAQLVGIAGVRRSGACRAGEEDGVAAADLAGRAYERLVRGEALVGGEPGDGPEREQGIGDARRAHVEVTEPQDHAELVACGVLTEQHRRPVRQLLLDDLERARRRPSPGVLGAEQAPRDLQRLRVVGSAHREQQRLGILRQREEGHAFVGIEAVGGDRARIERVEARRIADRAGHLVEERAQRQLAGHFAVHAHLLPRPIHHQRGADVSGDRHRHRAAQHHHVGPGRARLPVLVLDRLHDGEHAGAGKGVVHLRSGLGRRAVAEVPDDLGPLGKLLDLAEAEPDAGERGPVLARRRGDAFHAGEGEQCRGAAEQTDSHGRVRLPHRETGASG